MESQHDLNLALEWAVEDGQRLVEQFRDPEQKGEAFNAVRVWRRWERKVSQFLSPQDRESFLSFRSTPFFSAMGLRLEVANCIEKQLIYLRELISVTRSQSWLMSLHKLSEPAS